MHSLGILHLQIDIGLESFNTLQVPVIYNPEKIEAHELLVVLDDLTLLKLAKTMKETKQAAGSGGKQ